MDGRRKEEAWLSVANFHSCHSGQSKPGEATGMDGRRKEEAWLSVVWQCPQLAQWPATAGRSYWHWLSAERQELACQLCGNALRKHSGQPQPGEAIGTVWALRGKSLLVSCVVKWPTTARRSYWHWLSAVRQELACRICGNLQSCCNELFTCLVKTYSPKLPPSSASSFSYSRNIKNSTFPFLSTSLAW
jgi:hypothetical protein